MRWFQHKLSLLSLIVICTSLFYFRIHYPNDIHTKQPKVTTWDALGYYMYLPSAFIHHDEKELKWIPGIDSMYQMSGGEFYQANRLSNGNYVNKYLMGVSILQLPWFALADFSAEKLGFARDGFSLPYQYAIAYGCIFWVIISLFVLRKMLLKYFTDEVVAVALIATCLATNFIQYTAIEGGQSHAWIFPLYVFAIYLTIKIHEKITSLQLTLLGFIIGLACICRPTEIVMIFIPLLWTSEAFPNLKSKLNYCKSHLTAIIFIALGVLLGVVPQLLYWKRVTGNFVYDVGSKWDFLNPHFRVLFGWEKGWFIYTPICLLFIIGLFFLKKYPFKKAIITFTLLNIYIIIAWHVWRYGGSYSTRALVQSYPIMIFAMAACLEAMRSYKIFWSIIPLFVYLSYVNIFQIEQYNSGVLHYDDMNRKYYQAIYLNKNITPLDMSLLDTDEQMSNDERNQISKLLLIQEPRKIENGVPFFEQIVTPGANFMKDGWMNVIAKIEVKKGLWGSFLYFEIQRENDKKIYKVRLYNALSKEDKVNTYEFDMKLPPGFNLKTIKCLIDGNASFEGELQYLLIRKT